MTSQNVLRIVAVVLILVAVAKLETGKSGVGKVIGILFLTILFLDLETFLPAFRAALSSLQGSITKITGGLKNGKA